MSFFQINAISPDPGISKAYGHGRWPAAFPHAPWRPAAAGPRILAGAPSMVGSNVPPAGRRYFDSNPSGYPIGVQGLSGDPLTDLIGGAVGPAMDQALSRVIEISWAKLEPRVKQQMAPLVALAAVGAAASVVSAVFSALLYMRK